MKKYWTVAALCLLLLTGCGSNEHEGHSSAASDELPKEVKVEIQTKPAAVKAHENTEIQAIVTQDGKAVNDADDVKFEIWKDGVEQHEMREAKAKGDGVYSIEKEFAEDGLYHITAHTNARDMHVMPTIQITVGTGQAAQQTNDHSHASKVSIHLVTDSLQSGAPSLLQTHVTQNNTALTGAEVKFEVWKEGAEKHEYVAAKESKDGQYDGSFSFEAGTYHVNVHVVKGELHDHSEQTIVVQ